MSDRIIKLLSEETNLTTPGYVGASLLRLRNAGNTQYAVIVRNGNTITGSVTIYAGETLFIRKLGEETIETTATNNDIRCVKVSFGD